MTATLKPPPRFVHNAWAWAYVLDKLAAKQDEDGKQRLDEGGNPLNYAAAIAIYKRVEAKYGGSAVAGLPVIDPQPIPNVPRSELLAMDARVWTVSHNAAWAANDEAHQRLFLEQTTVLGRTTGEGPMQTIQPIVRFRVERYTDDSTVSVAIDAETAFWLVRRSPHGVLFVQERIEDASSLLGSQRQEIERARGTNGALDLVGHRVDPAWFAFDETVGMFTGTESALDAALVA